MTDDSIQTALTGWQALFWHFILTNNHLSFPVCRWGNRGKERLSNLSRIQQLGCDAAQIWTQTVRPQSLSSNHLSAVFLTLGLWLGITCIDAESSRITCRALSLLPLADLKPKITQRLILKKLFCEYLLEPGILSDMISAHWTLPVCLTENSQKEKVMTKWDSRKTPDTEKLSGGHLLSEWN